MAASLDAAALVGLLADDDRRRVFAALVLGARSTGAVAQVTELPVARTGKALSRLVDAGLVEQLPTGVLVLDGAAFQDAARAAAAARPADPGRLDGPPEAAKVLRAFVRDGRLVSIPAARSKRLVLLDRMAQDFEPGTRYTEKMVNLMLGRWYADTASLRRYLVDEGFLDRADGVYWRTGGTVSPT